MWFFKKRKARLEAAQKLKEAEQAKKVEVIDAKKVQEEKIVEPKKEVIEVQNKPVESKEVVVEKPAKKETKPKEVVKEPLEEEPKDKVAKYHISQNKKEDTPHYKEWRVRKEGSTKTIKFFKTQAEAIEYAKSLADNQDSSIVIHKVDGTVRKQDYSKK